MNYNTFSLKCGAPLEKEILWLDRRQKAAVVLGSHLTILGFTSCGDTILEEVEGFSPFMVSPTKNSLCLLSHVMCLCFCCACYSLSEKILT